MGITDIWKKGGLKKAFLPFQRSSDIGGPADVQRDVAQEGLILRATNSAFQQLSSHESGEHFTQMITDFQALNTLSAAIPTGGMADTGKLSKAALTCEKDAGLLINALAGELADLEKIKHAVSGLGQNDERIKKDLEQLSKSILMRAANAAISRIRGLISQEQRLVSQASKEIRYVSESIGQLRNETHAEIQFLQNVHHAVDDSAKGFGQKKKIPPGPNSTASFMFAYHSPIQSEGHAQQLFRTVITMHAQRERTIAEANTRLHALSSTIIQLTALAAYR